MTSGLDCARLYYWIVLGIRKVFPHAVDDAKGLIQLVLGIF